MRATLVALRVVVLLLLAMGIVLVASASWRFGLLKFDNPHHFLVRQLIWLGAAVAVGWGASRFDYHWWRLKWKWTVALYVAVVVVLLPLGVFGFIEHGLHIDLPNKILIFRSVNGSFRWLDLGPLNVQPSEFAKVALVIVLSVWLGSIGWRVRTFVKGAWQPTLIFGAVVALVGVEKDIGAAVVMCAVSGLLLFVAGVRFSYLLGIAAAGGSGLGALLFSSGKRMARINAWWSGTASTAIEGDHLKQSLLAFQSGGSGGTGFNQSIQKFGFLPEAHTDFIFAIGAEEFGFLFSILMLAAYAVILWCGIRISLRAPDTHGRLLAFGMTFLLVFQAAFNIAVVTGCFPTKGLALPFISYGGTNLLTAMIAVGTLVNVGRHVDVFDERLHTQVVKNAAIKL
jgi:cell division protein FtsW